MPLNINSRERGMSACAKEVALGISMGMTESMADMTEIRAVIAGSSAVRAVDGLGAGSCPEYSISDSENVAYGSIWTGGCVPKVVTRNGEGAGTEILKVFISFGFIRFV